MGWAGRYASRTVVSLAQIAFECLFGSGISEYRAEWTYHHAHPAANAFIPIYQDLSVQGIPECGAGLAGIYAGRFLTMTASERKGTLRRIGYLHQTFESRFLKQRLI